MRVEYVKFVESVKDPHQEGFRSQTVEHRSHDSNGKLLADIRLDTTLHLVVVKSIRTGQVVMSPTSNVRFLVPAKDQGQQQQRGK